MLQKAKHLTKRLSAFLLAVLVTAGTCLSGSVPVHAADGTIQYQAGASIKYGSYSTSRMTFDGSNTAYCVEPLQPTPSSGTYAYTLLGNDSPIRKALYYLNGGYGYDKHIKNQYLGGWSDDNSYVIGHLVVAYIRRFLDACDGNWHRCIYVECANCRVKNPCNQSGFLFCPDYRAVPLVLPLSDADILFACRPEPGECLAVFKDSVFLDMYAQFLKEQKILSPDCPCMALLDIQNKDCYDW